MIRTHGGQPSGPPNHSYSQGGRRRPPRGWTDYRDHHGPNRFVYDYTPRTPIETRNRFQPLQDRNVRTTPYNSHGYIQREEDSLNRSPFNYNYSHPGPSHHSDFPKAPNHYSESPERGDALEGGGRPKRKRM